MEETSKAGRLAEPPALLRLVATVLLPFGLGFFLSYLYRTVTAVIAPNLIAEVGLAATDLGFLASAYFLTYSLMQLPLGLGLDRFGPRRMQAGLILISAVGAMCFALATTRDGLALARALIGVGVCGGLMASLKAITLWFPQARWPLINGIFMTMGGMGALVATEPVELLLHDITWRQLFFGLAALSVITSATIFFVVPEKPGTAPAAGFRQQLDGLIHIYRDPMFWRIAPLAFITMGPGMAVQGLWAGPWLRDVAMLDRADVARELFFLAAALTAGFFVNGLFAEVMGRLGVALINSMRVGLAALLCVNAVIAFQLFPQSSLPWILFGLIGNAAAFAFPILSGYFPPEYSGRSNTALNVFVFGCAFLAQFAIGWILDFWQPVAGHYPPEGYRAAFGLLLGLQVLALLWSLVPVRR